MDARLDTLSIELYQINIRVSRIAQRQAAMGGFALEPTLPPPHLVTSNSNAEDDDDDDDGDDNDASDDDGDASSTEEMSALPKRCLLDTLPFVTCDKKGE